MHHTIRLGLAASLTLAALTPLSLAQTASPAPSADSTTTPTPTPSATQVATPSGATTAAATEKAVQMEKYQVSDVPIEQQILPTSRPFASVFGTDDDILDVPRDVTIISRQQMDTIGRP